MSRFDADGDADGHTSVYFAASTKRVHLLFIRVYSYSGMRIIASNLSDGQFSETV